jgi:hypothetical protein
VVSTQPLQKNMQKSVGMMIPNINGKIQKNHPNHQSVNRPISPVLKKMTHSRMFFCKLENQEATGPKP